jgi:hypothetical protein
MVDLESAMAQFFDTLPDECDFCWKPLIDSAIVWHCGRVSLFLHPACGAKLGRSLIRDAARAR